MLWTCHVNLFRDLKEARSRALENMGRVHARVGEFDTAIRV